MAPKRKQTTKSGNWSKNEKTKQIQESGDTQREEVRKTFITWGLQLQGDIKGGKIAI